MKKGKSNIYVCLYVQLMNIVGTFAMAQQQKFFI